ncbi:type II secretion system secretin GspD [bacterium]|nr:type II secretion system secretin GspD [candidate division CSSED10-310 bacterium]
MHKTKRTVMIVFLLLSAGCAVKQHAVYYPETIAVDEAVALEKDKVESGEKNEIPPASEADSATIAGTATSATDDIEPGAAEQEVGEWEETTAAATDVDTAAGPAGTDSGETDAPPPAGKEAIEPSVFADPGDLEKDIAAAAEEAAAKEEARRKRVEELADMFNQLAETPEEEQAEVEPVTIAGVSKLTKPKEGDVTEMEINLEDVPAIDAIKNIADLLEIDYILSPEVGAGGNVTIRTFGKLKLEDLYYVFLAILEMNNLVAVDVGPYYKIVPSADALHRPIETIYGKKLDGRYSDDTVLTQIIPLQYISPDEIISTLQPIIDQDASIITHPGSNLLIITGMQSNIKRLLNIIQLLDVDTAVLELEIFQINYADASDIVTVLERIFEAQSGGSTIASQARSSRTTTAASRRTRDSQQRTAAAASSSGGKEILFIPDTRSNSLIVFAQRKDIEFIREIIAMLDVDIYVSRKTYIYYVQNANAADMASLLGSIYQESGTEQRRVTRTTTTRRTQQPQGTGAIGGPSVEGEVHIVADERTNALIIVTSPINYPYIVETIEKLDIMPKQALIEVLIADISLNKDMRFGIDWSLRSQGKIDLGDDTYYFDGTSGQDVGVTGDTSSFYYNLFEATRFTAWLKAHSSDTKLEVLSNPHLLVANNMEAKIDIGSEVPIVKAETTYDTNVNSNNNVTQSYNRSIQYRPTGILMTVTPSINEARYVRMDIAQEVSEVSAWTTEGGLDSPVISSRKASTSVVVGDNQTLVIGGMIQRKNNPSRSGIPVLSKIPVLGWLFGFRQKVHEASELLIFLTPHVVTSPEEATAISESLRGKVGIEEDFYRDVSVSWK